MYFVTGPPLDGAVQLTLAEPASGVAWAPVTCPGGGAALKSTSTK